MVLKFVLIHTQFEFLTDKTVMKNKRGAEIHSDTYVMQLRSGEDPELWNTLKNAS